MPNPIQVQCPACQSCQEEPSGVFSTICRSCNAHLKIPAQSRGLMGFWKTQKVILAEDTGRTSSHPFLGNVGSTAYPSAEKARPGVRLPGQEPEVNEHPFNPHVSTPTEYDSRQVTKPLARNPRFSNLKSTPRRFKSWDQPPKETPDTTAPRAALPLPKQPQASPATSFFSDTNEELVSKPPDVAREEHIHTDEAPILTAPIVSLPQRIGGVADEILGDSGDEAEEFNPIAAQALGRSVSDESSDLTSSVVTPGVEEMPGEPLPSAIRKSQSEDLPAENPFENEEPAEKPLSWLQQQNLQKRPGMGAPASEDGPARRPGRSAEEREMHPSRKIREVLNTAVPSVPPPSSSPALPNAIRRTNTGLYVEVTCFQCSHPQKVPRKMQQAVCPKCSSTLHLGDIEISELVTTTVLTKGNLVIQPNGILRSRNNRCMNLLVMGKLEGAVECDGECHLNTSGVFESSVRCNRIVVYPDANLNFPGTLDVKEIEILGRVYGELRCMGKIIIGPNASVDGDVTATSISVDPSGSLSGSMSITKRL